jgi:hypothetical protein
MLMHYSVLTGALIPQNHTFNGSIKKEVPNNFFPTLPGCITALNPLENAYSQVSSRVLDGFKGTVRVLL